MSVAGRRTIAERDREARIRGNLLNGHSTDAEGLRVFPVDGESATPLFGIMLDQGWGERIIATGMYGRDAVAIAQSVGLVLECPVDTEAVDGTRCARCEGTGWLCADTGGPVAHGTHECCQPVSAGGCMSADGCPDCLTIGRVRPA